MMQARAKYSVAKIRADNRARSWKWAEELVGSGASVWRLERFKALTARAESGAVALPEVDHGRFSMRAWFQAILAMIIAIPLWLVYLLQHRVGVGQSPWPRKVRRVAAIHGEISTRTSHVLEAFSVAEPQFQAVVLIGRVQFRPNQIAVLWSKSVSDVPLFLPMSPFALFRTFGDLPRLVSEGVKQSARSTVAVGLREEVAIAFRIFLGAIAARWWAEHDTACEVVFGMTGTGDTTLLEYAIKNAGGRSIHAVHGQATGPNFLGVSDLALFRSRYDAQAYRRVGMYGSCAVQEGAKPVPHRGSSGLLLLSNLAHPMNPGFQQFGLRDEKSVLEAVGKASKLLGSAAHPLLWKPHPVIANLPPHMASSLRKCAAQYGFEEVSSDISVEQIARRSRWAITTPSTIALSLLHSGCLSLVVDPQKSVLDSAISGLPSVVGEFGEIAKLCRFYDVEGRYSQAFLEAINLIGPAGSLDLTVKLE